MPRNLINNSIDGDVGVVGNEPANLRCGEIPYTIIGQFIYMEINGLYIQQMIH